jgi:steroid delta-isomerase-like uncharacterized protein
VERYLGALNASDAEAAADCVAEDFFNEHTSALGHSVRGRSAYRARLPEFLAQFRELRYDVEDWIIDGDRCAVPYTMSCTFVDGDGTARPVKLRGIFRFRVRNGAIAHRVDYWDGNEFARQARVKGSA